MGFLALTLGVYSANAPALYRTRSGAGSESGVLQQVLQWFSSKEVASIGFGVVCAVPVSLPSLVPAMLGGPNAGPMPLMNPHCAAVGAWNVTTKADAVGTADDTGPTNLPWMIPAPGQPWKAQDLLSSDELAETRHRPAATPENSDDTAGIARSTLDRGLIACSSRQPCATNGKPLSENTMPAQDNSSPAHASAGPDIHRWSPSFWILLSTTLIGVLGVLFWLLRKKWFGARETLLRAARSGLKRGEFYLEYQPIVNLRQGKCVGIEALLRWDNVEFGAVGPGHYMPYIEQSSLIGPITRFVLGKVAEEVGQLATAESLYIGVNVPFSQLSHPGFVADLSATIPSVLRRLVLEISHREFRDAAPNLLRVIATLRKAGVRFALSGLNPDDGAWRWFNGWSFEMVKMNRAIFHLDAYERSRLLETLITLAHDLDAVLVGEGVEIAAHHDALLAARAELGQGFYYSRALSIGRLESFLASGGGATILKWRIKKDR
ncbi:EAL domain-containing protein [Caballeronia sp. SEWSISQ10-4 2]|uniref:EAL domain-containing protein n=1 Tax=Caballeronia sp. SEWSISQ10-4 2 TaxID=2937438 RepID=UPI002652B577|nr:EAL domain-containing protein [Caballeronia sp. SEWSISQ10-4 2]MDN7184564.1 EAL domain-containing protein [Caballeronia sp. SEWSISQ10-4 2]